MKQEKTPQVLGEGITRASLRDAKRIVVKLGTRVLVGSQGKPEISRISSIVASVAKLQNSGCEVVLVTSGAIGIGMHVLGLSRRPKVLSELQMCAAVGQSRLMTIYSEMFSQFELTVGQVLLTYEDLGDRTRHLNARNTFLTLLRNRIIPIVNENDVVSVAEIKFGDNDVLASLVAALIDADTVILLSTTDGLRKFDPEGSSERVSYLPKVNEAAICLVNGKQNELSVGGMSSKLLSAQRAVDAGAVVVIANGLEEGVLEEVLSGADIGTLIGSRHLAPARGRKRWIKFFQKGRGAVVIDQGAVLALQKKGGSLLPVGIQSVQGSFRVGDSIHVLAPNGDLLAKGLAEFSSEEVERICGKQSSEVRELLGESISEEVIHRDNLIFIEETLRVK